MTIAMLLANTVRAARLADSAGSPVIRWRAPEASSGHTNREEREWTQTRLGRGEMIAAVSALVLLIVMFIFTWFSVGASDEVDRSQPPRTFGVDQTIGDSAWQSFGFIDIVLFLTILVAIGVAVMSANAQSVNLPVAGSAIVTALGILVGPADPLPDHRAPRTVAATSPTASTSASVVGVIGVFLGLIAAGGIAYGGYEAMQEEGTSFAARRPPAEPGRSAPPPPPEPAAAGRLSR